MVKANISILSEGFCPKLLKPTNFARNAFSVMPVTAVVKAMAKMATPQKT